MSQKLVQKPSLLRILCCDIYASDFEYIEHGGSKYIPVTFTTR